MPKPVRKDLVGYLTNDIFKLFRGFFHLSDFRGSNFYYEMSFEFLPRKYQKRYFISIHILFFRYNPGEFVIK